MTRKKNNKKIKLIALFLFLFTLSFVTPTDSPNRHIGYYSIDQSILKSGDIIFRRGTSFVSRLVLNLDKRTPYSHTGIIKTTDDEVFVVHSVPGEEPGEKDKTKIDRLNDFLRRDRATAIAVYRLKTDDVFISEKAADAAHHHGIIETEFDGAFNLSDDSRLYCTELIWKAYLQSGVDLIDSRFDEIEMPLSKGPYILPGTLLESNKLKQIYSINFK